MQQAILSQARKDEIEAKVPAGERLNRADGEDLYTTDDLAWLGGLAHWVRNRMQDQTTTASGAEVLKTFPVSRHAAAGRVSLS